MESVGSTALVVLFDGWDRFFCASLGDCRAVLCRGGRAIEVRVGHEERHRAKRWGRYILSSWELVWGVYW
jgi:serine/threonine protein phosphatase PrpC